MASLVRVFKVKALEPIYRLALLTALAFMLCATLPLLFHLGHPERCFEIMMTPHFSSPMAMFGFVYAWYLMAVLLLELWFDYRRDFVEWSQDGNRPARHDLPRLHPGRDRPFRAGAASGCAHGPDHFHRRHSLGVSPARIRRFHFRLDQGQSVVGQRAHADHLSFFRRWFQAWRCACLPTCSCAGRAGSPPTCGAWI